MREAGATSRGKVDVILEVRTVHAPPGANMLAPSEVPRNVEGRKVKAAPRGGIREARPRAV
jgi:hypothetical protein